jgi:hypothetical protein
MSADAATGPFCTALGCTADAVYRIRTGNGEQPVCANCADGEEVVGDV